MATDLKKNGFGNYIYKGANNRVITEAYLDKEDANKRLTAIKKIFPDAYIVTFEIEDIAIDFSVTQSGLIDVKNFSKDIDSAFINLDRYMTSICIEGVDENLKELVEKEISYFETLHNSINNKDVSKESSYTYNIVSDCTKRTLNTYTEMFEDLKEKGQNKAVYWEYVIKTYFQYIAFLENL